MAWGKDSIQLDNGTFVDAQHQRLSLPAAAPIFLPSMQTGSSLYSKKAIPPGQIPSMASRAMFPIETKTFAIIIYTL